MGCAGSQEEAPAPAPAKAPMGPPPRKELTPAEIEARKREAEEAKRWEDEARRVGPPPPSPSKPVFSQGGGEDEYKNFMRAKYEYEQWENQIILLGRKLRKEAQAQQQPQGG